MQTHFLYMQSSQSIFSVITFQRFLFPFFPGIHMACSLWFYLNVTLFPQVVSVWNGPISNPSPRGINLMIFQCDLMSQVWSWCLAFFFFSFPELVCWASQSISSVLSSPGGEALWSSKVFLDMTDWPHPHSFHLTYMERSTEWWEGTWRPNNISIKR